MPPERPDLIARPAQISRTYQTPDRQQPLTSRPNQARARPARGPGHRASSTATSPIAVMAYTAEIDQQIEANEQETAEAYAAYLAGQEALRR